jgi:hypothetical protein
MGTKKYGKYRSRRKKGGSVSVEGTGAPPGQTGGGIGAFGRGMSKVGDFVRGTGKDIAKASVDVAGAGGDAIHGLGHLVDSEELKDAGEWSRTTGKDIAQGAADAAEPVGDVMYDVGNVLDEMGSDIESDAEDVEDAVGGGLSFWDAGHAAAVVNSMGNYGYNGLRSASNHIIKESEGAYQGYRSMRGPGKHYDPVRDAYLDTRGPITKKLGGGLHPILPHRISATSDRKHFHTIANSNKRQLVAALKNEHRQGKTGLHTAVSEAAHSANIGGGIDFSHHIGGGPDRLGGALSFDDVLQAGIDETVKPYKQGYKDFTYMTNDPRRFKDEKEIAKGSMKYYAGHWRVGQARLAGAATMASATGVGIPVGVLLGAAAYGHGAVAEGLERGSETI